jgi:hypothetical protein
MMLKVCFPVPGLYGDHHVLEVRRILLALPGVTDVYASSCFHVVEVSIDPLQVSAQDVAAALAEAGYLADLPAINEALLQTPRRQSVMLAGIGFQQQVTAQKSSAWPCPGMGRLKVEES